LDFNNDSTNDFLLSGNQSKYFVVHKSLKNNKISPPKKKFFFFPISEIKKFNTRKIWGDFYIALSYSRQLAALVSFTNYGTLQLLNTHSFKSSPSHLCVADVDSSGKMQALIYGFNFNGLSIIKENNFILEEKKYLTDEPFACADFIDLNYDGYPDIIAYNTLENSFKFLINNQNGVFNLIRVLKLQNEIKYFKTTDVNNDGFTDVAMLQNKMFTILMGDSVSSFNKSIKIKLNFSAKKFFIITNKKSSVKTFLFLTNKGDVFSLETKGKLDSTLPKPFILRHKIKDIFIFEDSSFAPTIYLYSQMGLILKLLNNDNLPSKYVYLTGGYVTNFYFHHSPNLFVLPDSTGLSENIYWGKENFLFHRKILLPYFYKYSAVSFKNDYIHLVQYSQYDTTIQFILFNNSRDNLTVRYLNFKKQIVDLEWLIDSKNNLILTTILKDSLNQYTAKLFAFRNQQFVEIFNPKIQIAPGTINFDRSGHTKKIFWENPSGRLLLEKEYFKEGVFKSWKIITDSDTLNSPLIKVPKRFRIAGSLTNKIILKKRLLKFGHGKIFSSPLRLSKRFYFFIKNIKIIKEFYWDKISTLLLTDKNKKLYLLKYFWNRKKIELKKIIDSFIPNIYFVTQFNKNKVYLVYLDNETNIITLKKISAD